MDIQIGDFTIQHDDADAGIIQQFKWYMVGRPGYEYPYAWVKGKAISLQKLLASPGPGEVVVFRDGDRLNFRRANLVTGTRADVQRSIIDRTTKVRGVTYEKSTGKYIARMRQD